MDSDYIPVIDYSSADNVDIEDKQCGEDSNKTLDSKEYFQGNGEETESYEVPLSRLVVSEAMESYGPINRAMMSKAIGVTSPGLYYNLEGKRRWFVDTWLKTLACLGRVKIKGNKIIIETPLAYEFIDKLKELEVSYAADK